MDGLKEEDLMEGWEAQGQKTPVFIVQAKRIVLCVSSEVLLQLARRQAFEAKACSFLCNSVLAEISTGW